jgi:hypothetical protein
MTEYQDREIYRLVEATKGFMGIAAQVSALMLEACDASEQEFAILASRAESILRQLTLANAEILEVIESLKTRDAMHVQKVTTGQNANLN